MSEARRRLAREARRLAKEFSRAAERHAGNEAAFKDEAEDALDRAARALGGTPLEKRVEMTLATGRADAVFNRLVVEWEPPGRLSAAEKHTGNRHAIGQVRRYVDGLAQRERRAVERLAGVACDGHFMIFARYRAGRWIVDEPVPVDEHSAGQLLTSLISAQTARALTADNLLGDFKGSTLLARQLTRTLLDQLNAELGHNPAGTTARLFDEWERLFAVATGVTGEADRLKPEARRALASVLGLRPTEVEPSRALFALQTYFAIVTKLIATLALSLFVEEAEWDLEDLAVGSDEDLLEDMRYLQIGGPFRKVGLANVIEPDVFGWYLADWHPAVRDRVREVVDHLKLYDPSTLEVSPEDARDLLKDLYQGLLPRPLRHALGQYFTPDWLALQLLDRVGYGGDEAQRIVDPACGTGTFLVLAIAQLKERLRKIGLPEREVLETVLSRITGFDIDPLAVVASRANYVLALGPLIRAAKGKRLDVPVYRADSIVSPELKSLHVGDRLVLETAAGKFALPPCVDTEDELRRVCDLADEILDKGAGEGEFVQGAARICKATEAEREVLADFYRRSRDRYVPELGGIWPCELRNAFMPAFVERFDLVVGNPPWVNWESLPASYRDRTLQLWKESGLFVHGGMAAMLGAGKKDVAMLMSYVVTDKLLREGGRLGFVITETVFKTAGAGQGFRRFRIGDAGPAVKVEEVHDMIDLKPFVGATNRTALMVWQRDKTTRYPVSYTVWQRTKSGTSVPVTATPEDLRAATRQLELVAAPVRANDKTSAWLTAPRRVMPALRKLAETGEPAYSAHAGVYSGANGVYWLSVDGSADAHGRLPVSNLHDVGKTSVAKRYGRVERDLVHPLIRGSDVSRWHAASSFHILLVQDPVTRSGISEATMKERYPGALEFLSLFEAELRARRGLRAVLQAKDKARGGPFWSVMGVGDYTLARHKVVWKDIATDFAAAVVSPQDPPCLPVHTVMQVACESADEAHYLCGMLNSAAARAFVTAYVATHISTHTVQMIHVPLFQPKNRVHRAVAEASKAAHAAVAASEEPDEDAVDRAAAKLWGLTGSELDQMRAFLAQLQKRDLADA